MDSMATISQDSSVFTITPKTITEIGEGVELTGSITFRASDGVNILPSVSSFTLSFVFLIENSEYTIFLLDVTDTGNTLTSALLSDASSNNWTFQGFNNGGLQSNVHTTYEIGPSGSSFTPFRSGGYSTYFDGNGDYLQLSATATDLLPETSNTTIEAWVNTTGTGHVAIFSNFNPSSPYNGMEVGLYNGYQTIYSQGSWINNTGGTGVSTINDGSWHHLAWIISNSGTTVTTYVDGVQNYTSSITASTTGSSNQRIGASSNSPVNRHFTGYISDVRFVKGTAIYSAAFTPPTKRLTDVSGTGYSTSLLTCHLPYIADGSNNNHTITVNGNTTIEPFTPYEKLEYSIAEHGISYASGRRQQNGDYFSGMRLLNTSDAGNFKLDANNFTIKFWMYPEDIPSGSPGNFHICGNVYSTAYEGFNLYVRSQSDTGNQPKLTLQEPDQPTSNAYERKIFNTVIKNKHWYYVELTNTNGTLSLKLNGVQESTTHTKNTNNTPTFRWRYGVGTNGSNDGSWEAWNFRGYLCDFQWVNGVTAAESSVPTAPLATHSNALVHFSANNDNVNIRDNSMTTGITAGSVVGGNTVGPVGSTAVSDPFGGTDKVLYFNGEDYLILGGGSDMQPESYTLGTSDFTIETWIRMVSSSNGTKIIADFRGASDAGFYPLINIDYTASGGKLRFHTNNAYQIESAADALTLDTWHHVAICRSGTSTKMYVDGTQVGSTYSNSNNYVCGAQRPVIGNMGYNNDFTTYAFTGYLYDFRISKGLARYTANFTPPTESFKG